MKSPVRLLMVSDLRASWHTEMHLTVINTTLTSFRSEVDLLIDPAYCVSLLAKLLAHAANAAEIEHDTYSEALCNIFGVLSRDRRWAIVFANDLIRILQSM